MSWDVEWAAEKASAALRYLADFYPECATSEVLHPFHDAAHQAAVVGDREAYLEALRGYMKAGRRVSLEARGWAA